MNIALKESRTKFIKIVCNLINKNHLYKKGCKRKNNQSNANVVISNEFTNTFIS